MNYILGSGLIIIGLVLVVSVIAFFRNNKSQG